jgi:hypothetical protein
MNNFPCPVCHIEDGFHDVEPHASLVIPPDKLIPTAKQRKALRDDRV